MLDKMERTVFANLEAQSKLINKTFKEMAVCITAYLEGNEDIHKSIAIIRNNEKETSKIRIKNLKVVAQAISIYRSDFFRLVMKMSEVMANQAGASVRLGKIKFTPRTEDEMILKFKSLNSLKYFFKLLRKSSSCAGLFFEKITEFKLLILFI